jgi:pimeloyl-ACP methyl ester carboxylesterase
MSKRVNTLPELPAEEHPYFLLPERTLRLEKTGPGGTGTGDGGPVTEVSTREIGDGGPVLLLPGLWTSALSFRGLLQPLSQKHRALLPEWYDPERQDPSAVSNTAALSDLALGLIRALSLNRPLLVGHAEAGLAGLHLALSHPEALGGLVVLGASLGPTFLAHWRWWWRARSGPSARWAKRSFQHPFRAAMEMLDYADPAVLSRQEIRHLAQGWSTLPAARARSRVLARTQVREFFAPLDAILQEATAAGRPFPIPLTLVYGQEDPKAPPEHGQRLNQTFPGSELLVAEGCRGAVHVERPEWCARVIVSAAERCLSSCC